MSVFRFPDGEPITPLSRPRRLGRFVLMMVIAMAGAAGLALWLLGR